MKPKRYNGLLTCCAETIDHDAPDTPDEGAQLTCYECLADLAFVAGAWQWMRPDPYLAIAKEMGLFRAHRRADFKKLWS